MSVAGFPLLEDKILTGLVKQFPYNARQYPLTGLFRQQAYGTDEIQWDVVVGNRGMATLTTLNGEGAIIARDGVKKGRATPAHIKEKTPLTNSEISLLRAPGAGGAPGTEGNPEGMQAVVRTTEKLVGRRNERVEWMCREALQDGEITYSDNNVAFTVNYGFTSLTAPGTDWDDASATIVQDIYGWMTEFADNAGFAANVVFFNPKLFSEYLLKNTEFKSYVHASPGMSEQVLRGITAPFQIQGIGVTWVPVMGQYRNDAGSIVDRWDVSKLTFANTQTVTGKAPFEWARLKNMENDFQGNPVARSYQDSGDSKQIWVLTYDNGLPIFPDQNAVQPVTVVAP